MIMIGNVEQGSPWQSHSSAPKNRDVLSLWAGEQQESEFLRLLWKLTESNSAACPFIPTAAPVWLSAHTYTRSHSIARVFSAIPVFLLHHTPTFQEQTFLELKSFLDCLPRPLALPLSYSMPLYCVWKHLGYGFIPCHPTPYKVLFSSSPSPTFFFLLIIYCLGVILLSFHSWNLSERFVIIY